MRTAIFMLLLVVAVAFGMVTRVAAQLTPAEETAPGTSALPTEQAPAETPASAEEDNSVTPPPAPTPSLPSQAKRSSLMVKAGDKELEFRLSYSHFSSNTVFVDGVAMLPVIVIGQIGVERVRKDIIIGSLAARYGLRDNLQAEIRVPFRYEHDLNSIPEADSSQQQESAISSDGIGDIEGNLYFQLPHGSLNTIRWIGSIGVKSASGRDIFEIDPTREVPMGSGFWSTKFGLTGVKLADPAAIYWNLGYTYNWKRMNIRVVPKDAQTGEDLDPIYVNVKPGNTYDFGGGVAYALNPRLSVNTGISVSLNQSTVSNGSKLANTAITSATMRFGMIWLQGTQPLDISASTGLTNDSPDFTLEMRRTYKF